MNKFRFSMIALAIMAITLMVSSSAQAQATRTWVSGVGDDVNPCSRTAPCKTYAGAISKTAAGGEISTLDPGGFGAVTITKSMTIDGTTGQGYGSILASGTNGVIVNDSASGSPGTIIVTLRNLSINGGTPTSPGTNGIRFLSGSRLQVQNCDIFNFTTTGVDQGAGIDIKLTLTAKQTIIKNTNIFNCTRGLRATTSSGFTSVMIDDSRFTNNTTDGLRMETGGFSTISDSFIAFNAGDGVEASGGGNSGANLINTAVVSNSGIGLNAANNTCRIGGATFIGNGTGISQTAANTVKTFGNNNISDTIVGGVIQLTPQQ